MAAKRRGYSVPLENRCQIKGCGAEYDLIYLRRRICDWHWNKLADSDNPQVLYEALNVPKTLRENEVINNGKDL